jgi:hypothetical protein
VGENLHKLGDFAPLIRCITRLNRMLDTMLDVVLKNRILNLLERGLYCIDLVDDIDTIAVVRDHARDTANLALDAAQSHSGRFLDRVSHEHNIYGYTVYVQTERTI